jgi:gentisate 1,2-dioxygenase
VSTGHATRAGELATFYDEISTLHLGALWTVLGDVLTAEPTVRAVPCSWAYQDLRPRVLEAGVLISAEEAERRVLVLRNPGLEDAFSTTDTLYAGLQLLLPGEVARTHRHTPSAVRFIVEGSGAFTSVDGEPTTMERGDFVTTPNWTWHDHGNRTDEPMIWLDGLDIPLVTRLAAVFYEEFVESTGQLVQPSRLPEGDSTHRWGRGMLPTYRRHAGLHSPVLNYRWSDARASLTALRDDDADPFDAVRLEYINPVTGGSVLPTMSACLQLLRGGEATAAHRHVASAVYHVAEGCGRSVVGGVTIGWEPGDTFAVPAWTWHEHAADGSDAVLFSFSDRPALAALGLDRVEPHPDVHQP